MLEPLSRHAKSGETIVRHLAEDPAFEGIGVATASRLWKTFGDELYALLGNGDIARLTEVLSEERAERLVSAWKEHLGTGDVIVWLDEHRFEPRLAKKIIRLWGAEAAAKLRDQPYAMMALADWPVVDAAGRRMGIAAGDPRRLVAAVEAVLYARVDQHHTWIGERDLSAAVGRLLKCPLAQAEEAVAAAVAQRAAIPIAGGYQAAGAYMMERYVADRIKEMLAEPAMGDLIAREVSDAELAAWLDRQDDLGVALDDEQREAVRIAVQQRFGIVRGGAGVGKTTVLKAVARACAAFGRTTHMMALAGRAAVRISEATGSYASTIAAFLKGIEAKQIPLGPESLVIIDEASMVDLPTMYRILRSVPDCCRLLLVGDPGQLPPIQFGLLLHVLVERPEIPSVVLTRVYRQTEATGIPAVAGAIRSGRLPSLPDNIDATRGGVALIPSGEVTTDQIVDVVADLGGLTEDLRIVCAVKAGPAGTEALNARFHEIFAVGKRRHPTRRLAEGEPVMFLKNDYQAGLRNGSLGRVIKIEDEKVTVDFDGTEVELSGYGLDDLALAYAITVHKAQGSSFRKVVIPIQKTRLLDRSLVYTAITRATDLAVMVGAGEVLRAALELDAHAERRETAIGALLGPR